MPEQPRRETELTLSSMALLAIFFGLVLLCGLCFGLGYRLGHRSSQPPSAVVQPTADSQTTVQSDISRPKPPATAPSGAAPSRQSVVVNLPPAAASSANQPDSSHGTDAVQPQVRPALAAVASPAPPALPLTAPAVAPVMAPVGPLMVQIAAVSREEDADVLVSALRSRGYAVVAHHEAADGLIHVRIGPFNSRDIANRWRMKLLGDGYNAIVQP